MLLNWLDIFLKRIVLILHLLCFLMMFDSFNNLGSKHWSSYIQICLSSHGLLTGDES